jgi:hypothetical protein
MSGPAQIVQISKAEEVRSYVLSMLIELAEMADSVHERTLATQIRDVAWPDSPRNQASTGR